MKINNPFDNKNSRIVSEWKFLTTLQKRILIIEYTNMIQERNLKVTANDIAKIFEQEKPKVIVGYTNGTPFMRVHGDSKPELIKRITDKLL
jgi:hypothetical protein